MANGNKEANIWPCANTIFS